MSGEQFHWDIFFTFCYQDIAIITSTSYTMLYYLVLDTINN